MKPKRDVDIVVISDLHLGTYGARASRLVEYLQSIRPGKLVLNGDIIDGWHFSKTRFNKLHAEVLKQILLIIESGIPVHYVTGNHDDIMRQLSTFHVSNFSISDGFIETVDNKRTFFIHGDVFDGTPSRRAKFLSGKVLIIYNILIGFNRLVNWVLKLFNKNPVSISKKIMLWSDKYFTSIHQMQQTARVFAAELDIDVMVCAHSHRPQKQVYPPLNEMGKSLLYLNSGDWVEHCSSLEYHNGSWNIFLYDDHLAKVVSF